MNDNVLANLAQQACQLSDNDLGRLMAELMREQKARESKAHAQAWNKVCQAIEDYVGQYGYITIHTQKDTYDLYRGDFAFGDMGEISIEE